MVDNENQWDELEYSDDENQEYYDYDESQSELDTDNTSSEYSEEDYENTYEDTEDTYDYDDQESGSSKKKNNMLPIIVLALLLLGVGGFFAVSKLSNNSNVDKNIADTSSVEQEDSMFESSNKDDDDSFFGQDSDSSDLMSVDFNESGDAQVKSTDDTDDTIATVKSSSEDTDLFSNADEFSKGSNLENNDIIVSYDKAVTRINPFKPPVVDKKAEISKLALVQNTEFEIIEPPTESVADTSLEKLLKTQISGILYDDVSPSAIVNLNGVDTFVKKGDTIYGFTIDTITRNKVQITYKNNTYTAAVGELFTTGTIDKPTVANLEKKFAGRYK